MVTNTGPIRVVGLTGEYMPSYNYEFGETIPSNSERLTWRLAKDMDISGLETIGIFAESIPEEDTSTFLRRIAGELFSLAIKYENKTLFPEDITGNEPMLGGAKNGKRTK